MYSFDQTEPFQAIYFFYWEETRERLTQDGRKCTCRPVCICRIVIHNPPWLCTSLSLSTRSTALYVTWGKRVMFFQQLETKPPNYFPRMCVVRVTPFPYILAVTPNIVDEVRWGKTLQCALKTHPTSRLHLTRFWWPSVSSPLLCSGGS